MIPDTAANFIGNLRTSEKCTRLGGSLPCPATIEIDKIKNTTNTPTHARVRCWELSKGVFVHRFVTYPSSKECPCPTCGSSNSSNNAQL